MTSDSERLDEWRRSSLDRPHFLIVCNHGVSGDHAECDHTAGCREVTRIGRLPWFPNTGHWWAAEGVDEQTVIVHALNGDDPGHDPWDIMAQPEPEGGDPNRTTIELICPEPSCQTWHFRSDDATLQAVLESVLSLILTQPDFRDAYTPSVSNSLVVLTLRGLWFARRHAAQP